MSQKLIDAITDMSEEDAIKITEEMLDVGIEPMEVIEASQRAMGIIGERFSKGEAVRLEASSYYNNITGE